MQVRIAAQCYDFVDGHIRQLDEDLRAFDGDLYSDRARLGLKVGQGDGARRKGRDGG
jgi:inhibitor of growth protein 4